MPWVSIRKRLPSIGKNALPPAWRIGPLFQHREKPEVMKFTEKNNFFSKSNQQE
jgi:hypothetical protein